MKHKNHDALIAMANGAKFPYDFQYKESPEGDWEPADSRVGNLVYEIGEFRIKTVPKPDIVLCSCIVVGSGVGGTPRLHSDLTSPDNVEFTFSAGRELKSVRLL